MCDFTTFSWTRTTARIALAGTPMSNDVDEIYSLISWVSPNFLSDKAQFSNPFGLPIKEGLYMDSTTQKKRRSTITLKSLRLFGDCLGLRTYQLCPIQVRAIIPWRGRFWKNHTRADPTTTRRVCWCSWRKTSNTKLFSWFGALGLLTAHPSCFRNTKNPAKTKRANSVGDVHGLVMRIMKTRTLARLTKICLSIPWSTSDDDDLFTLGFTRPIVDALIGNPNDSIGRPCPVRKNTSVSYFHWS